MDNLIPFNSSIGLVCWCARGTYENSVPRPCIWCHRFQWSVLWFRRYYDIKLVFSLVAVTHAFLALWEYMETIRLAAEPKCASNLERSIQTIDNTLKQPLLSKPLKALFGLEDLEHNEDFVSLLTVSFSTSIGKINSIQMCKFRSRSSPGRTKTGILRQGAPNLTPFAQL
jgi:hypothetical protein